MARAQDQKRWRANTRRKRIEVYLLPETLDRLDALAVARRQSRASILNALIDEAAPANIAVESPEMQALDETISTGATTPEPPQPTTPAVRPDGYSIRRSREPDEQRYDWIIVTDSGQRIALGPDPVRFWKWCGRFLDGSIFSREAKGNTRDEVARKLLDLPISTRR